MCSCATCVDESSDAALMSFIDATVILQMCAEGGKGRDQAS